MFTIYVNGDHYGYVGSAEMVAKVRAALPGREVLAWWVSRELLDAITDSAE